ncbi:MAG: hypothetical protein ACP5T2_06170 [Thermoprotei archaeon]
MDAAMGKTLYAFLVAMLFLDIYSLAFQKFGSASFYMALYVLIFIILTLTGLIIRLRTQK